MTVNIVDKCCTDDNNPIKKPTLENIHKYLQQQKSSKSTKCWRLTEKYADLENFGVFQKNRRIYKMLVPCRKIGGSTKCWHLAEI
jgi:hypothetical protein